MRSQHKTYTLVLAALFLALCLVLPMVTGGIPAIGLRLAVRSGGGICRAAAALGAVRHAAHVPRGPGYGL